MPDLKKQPAIYAITTFLEFCNKFENLFFYIDLHAHNSKKGTFIYGNCIEDYCYQVETQLFVKLLAMNDINFEYYSCVFSAE